jgi:hypothetical protein
MSGNSASKKGHCTDVVFVSVRQRDARNAVAVFAQITKVRDDEIYARQLLIGKHDAAIDDENCSSYSYSIMFLPISHTPPSGMTLISSRLMKIPRF